MARIDTLGNIALEPAVMLTAIQRELVKINPNIEVSFDQHFTHVARGLV